MAPVVTPRGKARAVLTPRAAPQVQHVWIYCKERDEAENIAGFCRISRRKLQRKPQFVTPCSAQDPPPWRHSVKLLVNNLPTPYTFHEWREFWNDVDALLSASVESLSLTREHEKDILGASIGKSPESMRFPSILVTDRPKLFHASSDTMLRSLLAEASGLRDIDLITVVLAPDFKTLLGNLVVLPQLEVGSSVVLGREDIQASGSTHTADDEDANIGFRIPVSPGIYFQYCASEAVSRHGLKKLGSVASTVDSETKRQATVGARALAVFSDGQCSYAAVSADGMRCVQAVGAWEVINGQFVIGGHNGNADVGHFQLVGVGQQQPVSGAAYDHPVHIALEDLIQFDFPTTLNDCVPRIGGTLREELLKMRPKLAPKCQVASCLHKLPNKGKAKRTLADELGIEATVSGSPSKSTAQGKLSDSGDVAQTYMSESANVKGLLHQSDEAPLSSPATSGEQCQFFRTCPLRPGTYHAQRGNFPGAVDFCVFEMTLHVEGSYTFQEGTVRLVNTSPLWSVEGGMLILGSREPSTNCFLRQEVRGSKDVEQKIMKIVIPVEQVLRKCTFNEFPQQLDPFPNHAPLATSKCICGLIDPASPAMQDPPAVLEHVPLRAVEAELHERGLNSNDLQSDLQHLDKGGDGNIDPEDLEALKSYGKAVGSPEQLNELRHALLQRFSSLNEAFDACCDVAKNKELKHEDDDDHHAVAEDEDQAMISYQKARQMKSGITFATFEKFLQKVAEEGQSETKLKGKELAKSKKQLAKSAALKVWLEKHTSEELQEVFASINASQGETIDIQDFFTLSLHTAMSSMQRLAHFQRWIGQRFGKTQDGFERAFETLDVNNKNKLKLKEFLEAVEGFEYPCSTSVLHCIFGLLDRNFKGSITSKEFENLRNFNSAKLLQNLQDLKQFADDKFGGIDECFQSLLKLESSRGGKGKSVSYKTFEKALTQGGFKQAFAEADLEMLFLFLDEASDQSTSGCLTYMEWQLLRGFESRAVMGSPARLRKFLEQQFGNMEEAYKQLQASWQARVVNERLTQAALNGLVRALRSCAHDGKSANFRNTGGWGAAKVMKASHAAAFFKPKTSGFGDLTATSTKPSLPGGGRADAAKRGLSNLGLTQQNAAEAQRPHTHEGTRSRSAKGASHLVPTIPSSARGRPSRVQGHKSSVCHLPYQAPGLPAQLSTEKWKPEAYPFPQTPEVPQSARCQSAPSAEQKALADLRPGTAPTGAARPRVMGTPPGTGDWPRCGTALPGTEWPRCGTANAEPRTKLQLVETQPGFTALHLACSGRSSSQGSSRNGWASRGAVSAINWALM